MSTQQPQKRTVVSKAELEPGSFRDRLGRVFYQDGRVLRALSADALAHFDALSQTSFYSGALASGAIVSTTLVDRQGAPGLEGDWAAVLEHQRIELISYPYEWSFAMLRDAALLHLELLRDALKEGMILKDSSAYNIQFRGATATHIDVASFEKLAAGDAWTGYGQFCEMFLFPLMLQAYRGADFQPWLRGRLDGISARDMNHILGFFDSFRSGVLGHVRLHARLQSARRTQDVRGSIRDAGFSRALIERNVAGLIKLIGKLKPRTSKSHWRAYADPGGGADDDAAAKQTFVESAVASRPRQLVWDLGTNTGMYARIAARHAQYVVALDSDAPSVDRLYEQLRSESNRKIIPLVMNLVDASPRQGWRGLERKDLRGRGAPDIILALALIHHVVLAANVPLAEFVGWLAGLGGELVIEFVTREDPMVRELLLHKNDIYHDYTLQNFEHEFAKHYDLVLRRSIREGRRLLFHGRPKGSR